jgi:2,3-bisphosphoglycerate-dependent phosphoglycerate mutase
MAEIYFVRHAQPVYGWQEESTRPLSEEGLADTHKVMDVLSSVVFDRCFCSPYKRSIQTIESTAADHNLNICTDIRFRERDHGERLSNPQTIELMKRRWADHSFHENGGESIDMVQRRNIQGINEILDKFSSSIILFGTHGTALSSILNYYYPNFGFEDFWRIVDYMPYIVRLSFNGRKILDKEEILIVEKKYNKSRK